MSSRQTSTGSYILPSKLITQMNSQRASDRCWMCRSAKHDPRGSVRPSPLAMRTDRLRGLLHPRTSSGIIPRNQTGRGHGPIMVSKMARVRQNGKSSLIVQGLDVIRKESWPFHRTIAGVRLCWELEEPQGPICKPASGSLASSRSSTHWKEDAWGADTYRGTSPIRNRPPPRTTIGP